MKPFIVIALVLCASVIGFAALSSQRQSKESSEMNNICQRMAATGGGTYDNCMKELKKQGY